MNTDEILAEAKKDALKEARFIISGYLSTAETWRYDRVLWAFHVMIGDLPEDSPEPPSPYSYYYFSNTFLTIIKFYAIL